MEYRCEQCKKLLFKFEIGTNVYGEISIMCKCKWINIVKGEIEESNKTIRLDNHSGFVNN